MGIEGFFKTIQKESIWNEPSNKINYLYIDFNSILYIISAKIDYNLSYILLSIIHNNYDERFKKISLKMDYSGKTIESYNKHFTELFIDDKTIEYTKKYLNKLFSNNVDEKSLKKIFISFDGIPNMGKLLEQKQRKYMAYVISGIKKKMYNDLLNKNKISKTRDKYEQNVKRFDRNKLVTWSEYMSKVEKALQEENYKDIFPNLESYEISGTKYPGEGEKKIMESIISSNHTNSFHSIYSPDADVILLSIILTNLVQSDNKFTVLHYDQEHKSISHINIDKFCDYVSQLMTMKKINGFDKIKVTNDFVLIATIFGNDFVPKVNSINVKNDFAHILSQYHILVDNDNNIINNIVNFVNRYTLNYANLCKFLNTVAKQEERMIRQKYINDHYDSVKIIKFMKKNNLFTKKSYDDREAYKIIKKYMERYSTLLLAIKNKKEYGELERDEKFKKILAFIEFDTFNTKDVITKFVQKTEPKIKKNYYIDPLYRFRKNPQIQHHHLNRYLNDEINKLIYDYEKELSEYDKNLIEIEWKAGKYKILFSKEDDDIGKIEIDKMYNVVEHPIDYAQYYESYLNVKTSDDKEKLLKEYFFSLIWTFDFYFNKNNKTENLQYVATWFYPHHKAPYLRDIVETLKTYIGMNFPDINHIVFETKNEQYLVERKTFFNRYEQMLYTVPVNKIKPIFDAYKDILSNQSIFPDMDDYVKKILNSEENYIDCRKITFIIKCSLKKVLDLSFDEFRQYLDTVPIPDEVKQNFGYTVETFNINYNRRI